MLRISKLTDYAFIVLGHMAKGNTGVYAAAELADYAGIAVPTVSKVLKSLARAGIVRSMRGAHGGYALSRPAAETTVASVIYALEGPIAITECSNVGHTCSQSDSCHTQANWGVINQAIRSALEAVSLEELNRRPAVPETVSIPLHSLVRTRPSELSESHVS